MTKKDFTAIASIVKKNDPVTTGHGRVTDALLTLTQDLASHFARDNKQFDRARFMLACGFKATD